MEEGDSLAAGCSFMLMTCIIYDLYINSESFLVLGRVPRSTPHRPNIHHSTADLAIIATLFEDAHAQFFVAVAFLSPSSPLPV